jgi:chemotaxis protein MotB
MSARRRNAAPPATDQRWLLTYGDLVTLLMAFFVMLFAISSVEQEKFEAFLSGLDQFGNPGKDPIGEVAPRAPVAPPIPVQASPADPAALAPSLQQLGQQLLDAVAAAGHPGAIEITEDDRGLGVSIETDRVLFAVGSAQITPQGAQIIAAMAPPLAGIGNEILLEGHADTTPLDRGGYTNWNLSTDRAVAVVNALVDRHGVAPHRLTASGFGEFRPRDPGSSAESKARNRRVELIVVQDPTDVGGLSDAVVGVDLLGPAGTD